MALLTVLLLAPGGRIPVRAMPHTFWSTPQFIPGLVDTDASQYPIFIADPTGKVHVIHSQWVGEDYSIMYSQWAVGVGWSQPVDVFMTTVGQARVTGAFLDDDDMLKVMFWGGEEASADIFFIQAPIQTAGKATAWSEAIKIGANALSPTTGTMTRLDKGSILAVYSGDQDGNGLYSVRSDDGGETWIAAQPFFFTASDTLWPSDLRMYQSADQRVHAVWSLADTTGNSRAIYYAAYDPAQADWSNPVVLAKAILSEADTANIIEHDGALMVIYHNDFPTTRWMMRSFDGGSSWTAPTRLFEHVGSNGAAALVIDSGDNLHMFFGNRVGDPIVHGLWHSIWQGASWSAPEAIVSGPQITVGENGEEGFDPSGAQAVISQGNLVLVVWRHDPMAGPINIWYSYQYLDTPQLPTATAALQPSPTAAEAEITPSPTTKAIVPTIPVDVPGDMGGTTITNALIFSIGPAVILILAVILLKRKAH